MLLIMTIIGLSLVAVGLFIAGLWLIQQEAAPRRPEPGPSGPTAPPLPPPDLQWKRSLYVPLALTTFNAALYIIGGLLGLGMPAIIATFFFGVEPSDWLSFSPVVYVYLLVLVAAQMWILIEGLKKWQKAQALGARGQLTQGVVLDRWTAGRGYNVAYYFDLPWGGPEGSGLIRAEINEKAYRACRVGDPVQVRYLPENPQVCRAEV